MLKMLCSLILITGLSFSAFAGSTAYLWDSGQTAAPLLIFASSNETAPMAAARYLRNLRSDYEMKNLFDGHWPGLETKGFREISKSELLESILLIGNSPSDLQPYSQRVTGFKKQFEKSGSHVFVLPLGIYTALSIQAVNEVSEWISENIPLLIPMGGDDVEPSLYGQEKIWARRTVPTRDQFEIQLISKFISKAKGFLFAICRGHQISSVSQGYRLFQDIPKDIPDFLPHSGHEHLISVRKTTHSILYRLFGEDPIQVNSLHHQAVEYQPNGPLEIAAVSSDGVIEAMELKNGHGLFVQFHPELMRDKVGRTLIEEVTRRKRNFSPRACSRVHF